MSQTTYITTTLPYVNEKAHMGHALEFVQADFFARFKRFEGNNVFFSTGTDEHGQKILQKATENGRDVQEYVDFYAKSFQGLKDKLNLSYDNFIRTTDESHIKAAQELWNRCNKKGDIYKKSYKGLYCVGCEMFVTEKDLVNGKCSLHPNRELEVIEEENYFFRLSRYQDALEKYLTNKDVIIPEFRRNEALKFVQSGLEDFSISRERARLSWGIPIPEDENQVMFVWFDALTNYISTLSWPEEELFRKFWDEGETIQFAGKDQIRFQSIMWQAMLMSVGLPTTDRVFYHGHITSHGQKMSKSIGNVVDPLEVQKEFGTDALRYYLLRHIHPTDDSDFTHEKFLDTYNGNLANGIGNLTSRILKMAGSYEVVCDLPAARAVWDASENREYTALINTFEFQRALDLLWERINSLDGLIAREEPYKVFKVDQDKARKIVSQCVIKLWEIAMLLEPALPETSGKMKEYITSLAVSEPLFVRK